MVRMEKRRTIRLSARGKYTDRYIPSRREKFAAGSLSSACLAHRVFQGAMEPEFPVVAGGTRSDDPSRHEMNGAWPNLSGTAGMGRTGDFRGGMPGGRKTCIGWALGRARRPPTDGPNQAGRVRRDLPGAAARSRFGEPEVEEEGRSSTFLKGGDAFLRCISRFPSENRPNGRVLGT